MQDASETPFDRYDTPWDGDEETQRLDPRWTASR